jgi:signal transduction histidine kinase
MQARPADEDGKVRRRIAAAFILLGLMATVGTALLVYNATSRIPHLNQQADEARAVQFHASSIARHFNFILAKAPQGSLADAAELDRRLDLIDADVTALARLRGPEVASLEPVRRAAARLAVARSEAAIGEHDRIRSGLDELIVRAGVEAQEVSEAVEGTSRAIVLAAAVASLSYLLLLAGAGLYVLRTVRRQQRAIADQVRALEDRNRDLQAFAGRVAHDLRGPLAPLAMAAELLERRAGDPHAVRGLAGRVRRSSGRAQGLIDSLLAFSTTGRAPSSGAHARVDACVASALEDQQDLIDEQGIELETSLSPALASIEPSLLRTVLYNLLSNAIRYLPREGRRRIEVRCWTEPGRVVLEVEDSGAGIPVEARDSVFDPFVRFSRVPGGVGLGLATVKRIVEAHDGTVRLGDGELGGTCVRVELRRAVGEVEDAGPRAPEVQRPFV